jgi:hypothetical protein
MSRSALGAAGEMIAVGNVKVRQKKGQGQGQMTWFEDEQLLAAERRARPKPSPQLRTRWTATESAAHTKRTMQRFAERSFRRLKSLVYSESAINDQEPVSSLHDDSVHSMPEIGMGLPARLPSNCAETDSACYFRGRRPIYCDDLYELYESAPRRATSLSPRASYRTPSLDDGKTIPRDELSDPAAICQRKLSMGRARTSQDVVAGSFRATAPLTRSQTDLQEHAHK